MRKWIALFIALALFSCSYIPFIKKKTDTPTAEKAQKKDEKKVTKGEKVEEEAPKPGDIKVIDGIEYIYARNRRFMLSPYEPEYVWIRKDQYSPSLGETLALGFGVTKEREELEKRIAKLEEELKKKGIAPQMVYPYQMGVLPPGMGYMPMMPLIAFNYPSPKMKRRVIVMPIEDHTNYKEEQMGELATKRLISRLENTGAIICIDPNTIPVKGDFTDPAIMKQLNELYGVHVVIKGTLSDIYTSTSKIEGKDEKETSFAMSKMALQIYNTETGSALKQLLGRNPVSLTREKGDMSSEKAKIKAIDLAIEIIAEDLLRTILTIDWHARIASIDGDKVYINAGRLSGFEKGDMLSVYAPGEQIIDAKTQTPLGRVKGNYKGDLEVFELFGVDACMAKIKKGGNFSPSDFVYLQSK